LSSGSWQPELELAGHQCSHIRTARGIADVPQRLSHESMERVVRNDIEGRLDLRSRGSSEDGWGTRNSIRYSGGVSSCGSEGLKLAGKNFESVTHLLPVSCIFFRLASMPRHRQSQVIR
jgi:hypothetical protein